VNSPLSVLALVGAGVAVIAVAVAVAVRLRRDRRPDVPPGLGEAEEVGADLRLGVHLHHLSRLNAALAHDIRGPLNTMVLNLELLRESIEHETAAGTQEQRRGYVRILREELKTVHRMIETLLVQTRMSEGVVAPLDLRTVVHELGSLIQPHCHSARVTLEVSVPALEIPIEGNRDELRQALLPLVMDALDALPPGGALRLSLVADQRLATIAIAIPGQEPLPGPSPAILGEPATSRSDRAQRAARSVIDAHRGRLASPARPNTGLCFEIELPLEASHNGGTTCSKP